MPEHIERILDEHPVCEQCGTMMRKLDPQPLRPAIYFKCPGCDWIVAWVNHFSPQAEDASGDEAVVERWLRADGLGQASATSIPCWATGCTREGIWTVPGINRITEVGFDARFCDEHRAPAMNGQLVWEQK